MRYVALKEDGIVTEEEGVHAFYFDGQLLRRSMLWSSAGCAAACLALSTGVRETYPSWTFAATATFTVVAGVHTFSYRPTRATDGR